MPQRNSPERVIMLEMRREAQRARRREVIKANLLWSINLDPKTGISRVRLLRLPEMRPNVYVPHQGKRECARRVRQMARISARG